MPRTCDAMTTRTIFITEQDFARLTNLVGARGITPNGDARHVRDLRHELDRAIIVPGEAVPPDVITMNSKAVLRDLKTGEHLVFTLVFPGRADMEKGQISVLAPIGTALIGYRVGDIIEWEVPAGTARLKVEGILYQPEAAGTPRE